MHFQRLILMNIKLILWMKLSTDTRNLVRRQRDLTKSAVIFFSGLASPSWTEREDFMSHGFVKCNIDKTGKNRIQVVFYYKQEEYVRSIEQSLQICFQLVQFFQVNFGISENFYYHGARTLKFLLLYYFI